MDSERCIRSALIALLVTTLIVWSAGSHAQTAPQGYLKGAALGYSVPKPPTPNSDIDQLDLVMVRAAQVSVGSPRWLEAVVDAKAYAAPDITLLFATAAGTDLSAEKTPILVYIIKRVIQDAGGYAQAAKTSNPRSRPYVDHADLKACYTPYLKDGESYPSGHAMNGYSVALVLTELLPERKQPLLALGVRYGDNRVVCGVHHPIDVEQGRLLAIAYVGALRNNGEFKSDLDCAKHEIAVNAGHEAALGQACEDLRTKAKSFGP